MKRVSLDGPWRVQLLPDGPWLDGELPGCWDELGAGRDLSGPVRYRRRVELPAGWQGRRVWLHFGAVSYACRVLVNGSEIGVHRGAWDAFRFEATEAVVAGSTAEIVLEIEKPASLSGGPDSAAVPGRFPTREVLAGFLPFVWGHLFGGPWQSACLEATSGPVLTECHACGDEEGNYLFEGRLSEAGEAELSLFGPDGDLLLERRVRGEHFRVTGRLDPAELWSPTAPRLYRLEIRSAEADAGEEPLWVQRFGFRSLRTDGTTLILNGAPLYPRMVLSWGWYPDSLHSNPGAARFRSDLERLRTLGFNGVKLCLWVPPRAYFEMADEIGMLLWLELPMWLPRASADFAAQTTLEYERIVRQVRSHPSLLIYSLGCELNDEIGAGLLGDLYRRVKLLAGDALLRDNSGSGEAYGGLLDEFADYYDHHFYSELQHFAPLLDHFTPRWRAVQPWLFGEFCDSDTFRDLRRLDSELGERPWWAQRDSRLNPQGARWQFDLVDQESRLRALGLWHEGERFERVSYRSALLQRKATLEMVRARREISGYVVTGEADTPISTSGLWDDAGRAKFPAESFRVFNSDTVLLLGWGRNRAWLAGGDRAAFRDRHNHRSGERVRAHLIVSHYGAGCKAGTLRWQLLLEGGADVGEVVAAGEQRTAAPLGAGSVREIAIADFVVPELERPRRARLEAVLEVCGHMVANAWPLWLYPRATRSGLPPIGLVDPTGTLRGVEELLAPVAPEQATGPLLASEWTAALADRVAAGADLLLLASGRDDDPLASVAMPFWREAIKLIEPHPAWGDFPHDGWVDLPFFPVASDRALDTGPLETAGREHRPLLWRLDARTMARHAYATEFEHGRGRVLMTSLRLAGGSGDQPIDLLRNTAGSVLLVTWLRWLHGSRSEREEG